MYRVGTLLGVLGALLCGDLDSALHTSTMSAAEIKQDLYGDPLPEGAVARFGTVRFLPRFSVLAIALSPDGKAVATGSIPGSTPSSDVEIWDTATGKGTGTLLRGTDNIHCIAWSPDGRYLAVSHARQVEIFEVATRTGVGTLEKPRGKSPYSCWSLCWSPNGKWLAACWSESREVCLWDAATRKLVQSADCAEKPRAVAFSPDSKLLAAAGVGFLHVRDVATFTVRMNHEDASSEIRSVAVSPDGKTLAGAVELPEKKDKDPVEPPKEASGCVRFWDASTGQPRGETARFEGAPQQVAFTPDGKMVVSHDNGGFLRLWDPSTKAQRARLTLPGYAGWHFSISGDGTTLATAGRRIAIWDLATAKPRKPWDTHGGCVNAAQFSPDGGTVFSGGGVDGIRCWDPKSGRLLRRIPGTEAGVIGMALSHGGKMGAAGAAEGMISLWDPVTGQSLGTLPGHKSREPSCSVFSMAFDPAAHYLVSGGTDKTVRFWDLAERKEIRKLDLPGMPIRVILSSDGKTLAVGVLDVLGVDARIRLYEFPSGREIQAIARSASILGACDFLPGRPCVAVPKRKINWLSFLRRDALNDWHAPVRLWDYQEGKELWATKPVVIPGAIKASHAGRFIAVATWYPEDPICVFSAQSGELLKEFRGHFDGVRDLAFSPDDSQLLSAGQDGTLLLWDISGLE